MFDALIAWSLRNRLLVIVAALMVGAAGTFNLLRMPVDVFPDLTAPTVTVITEAHGMAPEEVESLITFPIETTLNGATAVRRVRSATAAGISVVWVEFEWGSEIFRARQIVGEKLQLLADALPSEAQRPVLAPISSIMGEIMFVGLRGSSHSRMALREVADWTLRRRLLALPGVAQVVPIGGEERQYQVLLDPARLRAFQLPIEQVLEALRQASQNGTGGFLEQGGTEYLVRGLGRAESLEALGQTVVGLQTSTGGNRTPILLEQVAQVQLGPGLKRGEGSMQAEHAVIIGIQKQPGANTLELTRRIDQALDEIQTALPPGMTIDRSGFRQADFISRAIHNVTAALRDGAILVALILLLFLGSWRTTFIALTALPVSILLTALVLAMTGDSLNTMSIGGITIAIGALVDDAIIDVENVLRRLRENRRKPLLERLPVLTVVYLASREVRGAILFGTLIVVLVFLPLFFLSGVEGRLLRPLGISYIVSILASFVVALSLTPVLSYLLLGTSEREQERPDAWLARVLKGLYAPLLRTALRHPGWVLGWSAAAAAAALAVTPFLGRSFLPEFNEGSLTIGTVTLPGTSLGTSDSLGTATEKVLLEVPEVQSTTRRTGRAELDEHAQGVNGSELDAVLALRDRPKEAVLADLRQKLASVPGVQATLGGPIAHRIDHMLSGTRAQLAVKIFGEDLERLRNLGKQVEGVMKGIDGLVDLSVEQQVNIPQLKVRFNRLALASHGLTPGALGEGLELALQGKVMGRILENGRAYDLVARFPDAYRADPGQLSTLPIQTPVGLVPLGALASVSRDVGPNTISRENVQRKLVVSANVAGRDLRGAVDELQAKVRTDVSFPPGYFVSYGGQFESEAEASRVILWLSLLVGLGIFFILSTAFQSLRSALIILVNLPLALIGGIGAVLLSGGVVSIASLVGFITLFGIATRNGIMMVSHYLHLLKVEQTRFEEAIVRGSEERLLPVLMTALTAGLALIPLVIGHDQPGNELQSPLAMVVLGGLLSSTLLNMLVIPPLFARYGKAPEPSSLPDSEPSPEPI